MGNAPPKAKIEIANRGVLGQLEATFPLMAGGRSTDSSTGWRLV